MLNLLDFDCISYFDVLSFNEYSNHAPITLHFNIKSQNTKPEKPNDDSFITRKIVWDDSKINLFHSQLLSNSESMQRLISDVHSESIVGNPRTPRVDVSFGHTQNKCRRFAL